MAITRMHTLEDLPTPAVVIDLPTVRRNIARMADYCAKHKIKLRPHTKTHKSVYMARLQLNAGANGLTVAKAGEAAVMAEASDDILVAYPALDAARCDELARLAVGANIRIAIDSSFAADRLAEKAREHDVTFGILVDLDVGVHRTGVQTPEEAARLAAHVARSKGLRLDGIMSYPGHVYGPPDKQAQTMRTVSELLAQTVDLFRRDGFAVTIVSGGSSPSAYQSHLVPQFTEIRPGTYIYNDMTQVDVGVCTIDDCAARVVATVVSDAVPGKFVLDSGSKTLTQDRNGGNLDSGFGKVVEYPQAKITRLTEEHAEVDASKCDRRPKLGERVNVIPNHICPCINLHDVVWLRDEKEAKLTRLPIDARGKVS
jgi:D-serine deaminase-like pyridoxal phosphate-dependent protein